MSTESRRIRVLLVDDHSIVREGLQSMLKDSEEFEVLGQARDGVEAVSAASELSPDVIVMDVIMPRKDGVEACREIMESAPDTRVVMLTASTEEEAVIEAVAAGATGYLQKVSGMDRLLDTLKLVAAGEMQVPPEVVRRVFARIRREAKAKLEEERDELTGREKEMLASFSRGMSYAAIAEARGVKPVTIRNALYSIQSKLGLGTKQEIVVWAVRNGLLDDWRHGRLSGKCRRPCRPCYDRAVADFGEPSRPSHISKMVLSIVKFGGAYRGVQMNAPIRSYGLSAALPKRAELRLGPLRPWRVTDRLRWEHPGAADAFNSPNCCYFGRRPTHVGYFLMVTEPQTWPPSWKASSFRF